MNGLDSSKKVVMIGNANVGKTSIILQLVDKVFTKMVTPNVGACLTNKEIETSKGTVSLKIWDTAGEERYRSITRLYSKDAYAAVIVFDVTDQDSFDAIEDWEAEFRKDANNDAIVYLAGNKIDLIDQRKISFDQANQLATKKNMKYFDVSAKTGENVDILFQQLATQLGPSIESSTNSVDLNAQSQQKGSCC